MEEADTITSVPVSFSEHPVRFSLIIFPSEYVFSDDANVLHEINLKKAIDLSRDPDLRQVVTVMGSDQSDLIIGNQRDNYISGGRGTNYLYGKGGKDVYVIKQGDQN